MIEFEHNVTNLTKKDKDNILTVSALWDELVPYETSTLSGANNIKVATLEHIYAIAYALLFEKKIIKFICS